MKETKKERFRRIAVARVNKIIKMVQLLGNCSNTSNYDFSQQDVSKVFAALRFEIDKAEKRFVEAQDGKKSVFSLDDSPQECNTDVTQEE